MSEQHIVLEISEEDLETQLPEPLTIPIPITVPSSPKYASVCRKFETLIMNLPEISLFSDEDADADTQMDEIEEPITQKHFDEYIEDTSNHPYTFSSQTDLLSMKSSLLKEKPQSFCMRVSRTKAEEKVDLKRYKSDVASLELIMQELVKDTSVFIEKKETLQLNADMRRMDFEETTNLPEDAVVLIMQNWIREYNKILIELRDQLADMRKMNPGNLGLLSQFYSKKDSIHFSMQFETYTPFPEMYLDILWRIYGLTSLDPKTKCEIDPAYTDFCVKRIVDFLNKFYAQIRTREGLEIYQRVVTKCGKELELGQVPRKKFREIFHRFYFYRVNFDPEKDYRLDFPMRRERTTQRPKVYEWIHRNDKPPIEKEKPYDPTKSREKKKKKKFKPSPVLVLLSEVWLTNRDIRKYSGGINFVIDPPPNYNYAIFNTYFGLPNDIHIPTAKVRLYEAFHMGTSVNNPIFDPKTKAFLPDAHVPMSVVSVILRHMFEVISNKDLNVFFYMLFFFRWKYRNLGSPTGTALLIHGLQGCGKSEYFKRLVSFFSPYTSKYSLARIFFTHCELKQPRCLFTIFEETGLASFTRAEYDDLKERTTGDTSCFRFLYEQQETSLNYCSYIMLTNQDDFAKHLTEDDRRIFPTSCSSHRIGNKEYFEQLSVCLQDPGIIYFYAFIDDLFSGMDKLNPLDAFFHSNAKIQAIRTLVDPFMIFLRDRVDAGAFYCNSQYTAFNDMIKRYSEQFWIPKSSTWPHYFSMEVLKQFFVKEQPTGYKTLKEMTDNQLFARYLQPYGFKKIIYNKDVHTHFASSDFKHKPDLEFPTLAAIDKTFKDLNESVGNVPLNDTVEVEWDQAFYFIKRLWNSQRVSDKKYNFKELKDKLLELIILHKNKPSVAPSAQNEPVSTSGPPVLLQDPMAH